MKIYKVYMIKGIIALLIMSLVFIVLLPAWILIWLITLIPYSIMQQKVDFNLEFFPYVFKWDFLEGDD